MEKAFCDCIIPFYNEGERILKVLSVVVKIKELKKIICVDDASEDKTRFLILKKFPQVVVVRLKKNLGKAGAVGAGLKEAKAEYVLLLDADLQNLQAAELRMGLRKIKKNPKLEMIVFRRDHDPFWARLMRSDLIIVGERILKRQTLEKVFQIYQPKKYRLEVMINDYLMKKRKRVGWLPMATMNTFKFEKMHWWDAGWREARMIGEMLSAVGVAGYWRQVLFFCRKEIN